jgi:hypothetical protein
MLIVHWFVQPRARSACCFENRKESKKEKREKERKTRKKEFLPPLTAAGAGAFLSLSSCPGETLCGGMTVATVAR